MKYDHIPKIYVSMKVLVRLRLAASCCGDGDVGPCVDLSLDALGMKLSMTSNYMTDS